MDGSERLPWTALARMRACEHRAVTKGAAQATESGAHDDATRPKRFKVEPRAYIPAVVGSSRDGRSVERCWWWENVSNSNAAKEKRQLGGVEPATAVVRGQDVRSHF